MALSSLFAVRFRLSLLACGVLGDFRGFSLLALLITYYLLLALCAIARLFMVSVFMDF